MDWKTHCLLMMEVGKKNVSNKQRMRFQFHLITILIQNQAIHHPNQRHHLLKHPHYQLNTLMIINKHSLKKTILDHGHKKKFYKKSRSYISSVEAMKTMNFEDLDILPSKWIYLLKYESISDEIYENLKNASCKSI